MGGAPDGGALGGQGWSLTGLLAQLCSHFAAFNGKPLNWASSRNCTAGKRWRLPAWGGPSAEEASDDTPVWRFLCSMRRAAGWDLSHAFQASSNPSLKVSTCYFLKD